MSAARDQIAAIEANKTVIMGLHTENIVVSPQVNEIKDLDDKGSFGGFLNVFSNPSSPDLERDYFDKETDFWLNNGEGKSAVIYAHGSDKELGTTRLDDGFASLVMKDAGVWLETQLKKRNKYEEMVHQLAKKGKLGLSSGTASHLVEREKVDAKGNKPVNHIKQWPLGLDATLTPTPAEPRTSVTPLKDITSPELKSIAADILQGESASDEKVMSIMDRIRVIANDFKDALSDPDNWRVRRSNVFDDFIITQNRDSRKLFRVEYSGSVDDGFSFQPRSEWTEVVKDEQFVARSVNKTLDDINELIKHRDGADKSEKDLDSLFDDMNQMIQDHA
jgi:hypothetical protein